jgi:hypothetical protein
MKLVWIYLAVAISAAGFVTLYSRLIHPKSKRRAIEFALLFGLANSISTSFGGYAVHPIPGLLAVGWFVLITIESLVAGLIAGAMLREPSAVEKSGTA